MAITTHTLENRDQQRNLLKAAALLALATELILDNAVYEASSIMSDLEGIQEFVNGQIDDRLLQMNAELNPYYEQMHYQQDLFSRGADTKVTDLLQQIRGTEFLKEEAE